MNDTESERKKYDVADGVEWVNGTKVPDNRIVELTEKEAAFDIGLGRISEREKGGRKAKQTDAGTAPDPDDAAEPPRGRRTLLRTASGTSVSEV